MVCRKTDPGTAAAGIAFSVPLPGAKTRRVFIVVPAGGENVARFHPFFGSIPDLLSTYPQFWPGEQRHGRHITPLWRLCFPFGRAMPP
ncbi:MAG: hypothetical protein LBK61_03445 [Spirochaetaceae bacterium]|nr:hypothetical protein [Spirochaetaceae bacterium]